MSIHTRTAKPVVFFYVQHLLGIGHVFRATRVARALTKAGCTVHLVWGGTPVPSINLDGLNMIWLPPVRSQDEGFQNLLNEDGTPVTDADRNSRRDVLVSHFHAIKPDIVITEAYPFGRRLMRFELNPLMDAASAATWGPLKVASIRDIMQEGRAENRVRESLDRFHKSYDLVMVHGDPKMIRLEQTLQGAHELEGNIRYCGLVTPDKPSSGKPSIQPDVLVSAGGGAVGRKLMLNAVEAMSHSKRFPTNWCLTTGMHLDDETFEEVSTRAPYGMSIVRFIPDMVEVLAASKVSVSRAGYNTVGDLLRSETACVLVPFTGGKQSEQLHRAKVLDEMGIATLLLDEEATPEKIAQCVDAAADHPMANHNLNVDGASHAADMLISEWNSKK